MAQRSPAPTIPRSQFGRALRRIREDAGLSQTALAALTKIDQGSISSYETSRYVPTEATLTRLREALPLLPSPDLVAIDQPSHQRGLQRGPLFRPQAELEEMTPDGRLVYQKRLERGWTLSQVASKAGVDVTYLSAVERGRRPLSAALRQRLEGVLL
jgi:transcriptional regulator with XRE-family HTH domain